MDFVVLDMQEDMKIPLIIGRPFLSTTNAHIDVGAREIKFHINGKEEGFTFKPRPEQCSNVEWSKKLSSSIKASISRTRGHIRRINANGEVWFGGLKIPNPHREVNW